MARRLKEEAERQAGSIEWWFRQHYQYGPRDPRYLETTMLDRARDYWAWLAEQRQRKGADQVVTEDFEELQADLRTPGALDAMLAELERTAPPPAPDPPGGGPRFLPPLADEPGTGGPDGR